MLTRHTLHLPNLDLSYLLGGNGSEALLLIHGMADSAMVWTNLAEHLGNVGGDRYRIIAPDLRGHGESSKDITDYSFASIIADLEALMEHLGITSAHVLAHSWSAKTVAIWATQKSDRFRSLILVDPFFIGRFPSWIRITFPLMYRVLPFLKVVGNFPNYETVEKIARSLKQYQGWSDFQKTVFQSSLKAKPDGTWQSKFPLQARDFIFEEIMDVEGLTQSIDIPTLFVQPKQGLNRQAWQLRPYQKYFPNLQICEVLGNHWAFLVEPEAFNQAIANFLQSITTTNYQA
ncbi:alpha/beta fold hydrolase [Pseudanabaena sp. ABRG5-3]|uniref:alpha/beta fold hydrolase n=1 Tax=Pseudanabaena sp. ABRG5-3 TaxID=685565 RepID=UPI000DC7425C|nr:alpha/beta hydrolase [Pseudanabaena sp. ABRG5-3]BBC26284.1 alpha/beta hydrolase fold protein [Pseudanabaena sp. ABRG5-3]